MTQHQTTCSKQLLWGVLCSTQLCSKLVCISILCKQRTASLSVPLCHCNPGAIEHTGASRSTCLARPRAVLSMGALMVCTIQPLMLTPPPSGRTVPPASRRAAVTSSRVERRTLRGYCCDHSVYLPDPPTSAPCQAMGLLATSTHQKVTSDRRSPV